MSLSSSTSRIASSLAFLLLTSAPAAALEIDGQVTVTAHYVETDVMDSVRQMTDGQETHHSHVETHMDFELLQKVRYHKEGDGESISLVPDPQRAMRGTYVCRGSDHGVAPSSHGIPTTARYEGTATGKLAGDGVPFNAEVSSRGLLVNLTPGFKVTKQGSGEIRSFATKGTIDNPQNYVESTPYAGAVAMPDDGSDVPFNLQIIPPIPPQSGDEDPNITMNRMLLSNPMMDFAGDVWAGSTTTRTPTSIKMVFRLNKDDPTAKQQSEESRTQETKVSRRHSKSLEVTVVVLLGKPANADLFIEPASAQDYNDWVPVPASDTPAIAKLYGPANAVSFHVFFKSKDPKHPNVSAPLDFYLRDVSKHQGRSGNEPVKLDGVQEPDLRFAKDQPGGVQVDPKDSQHAFVSADVSEATFNVEATDAGAYGKIAAYADSLGLRATCQATGEEFMDVPHDANHNHIADAWETSQGILANNYPSTWDEEALPAGIVKGDGLTLYEEYRGFVINAETRPATPGHPAETERRWQRLPVGKKKLFVYATEGADHDLYVAGAKLFAKSTGIRVIFMANQDDDLQPVEDQVACPEYMKLTPRWLNFNSKPENPDVFGQRQFAVIIKPLVDNAIIRATPKKITGVYARTRAIAGVNETDAYAPERIEAVYVLRDKVAEDLDIIAIGIPEHLPPGKPDYNEYWLAAVKKIAQEHGIKIDLTKVAPTIAAQKKTLTDRAVIFTIAHELGHAVGMDHHHIDEFNAWSKGEGKSAGDDEVGYKKDEIFSKGEITCPMRYWATDDQGNLRLLFATGNWDPSAKAPDGQEWNFCNQDHCMPKSRLKVKEK